MEPNSCEWCSAVWVARTVAAEAFEGAAHTCGTLSHGVAAKLCDHFDKRAAGLREEVSR